MAKVISTLHVSFPWRGKIFMASVILAIWLRIPVDCDRAARFLVNHSKFEVV